MLTMAEKQCLMTHNVYVYGFNTVVGSDSGKSQAAKLGANIPKAMKGEMRLGQLRTIQVQMKLSSSQETDRCGNTKHSKIYLRMRTWWDTR